jgi:hypothetical protein
MLISIWNDGLFPLFRLLSGLFLEHEQGYCLNCHFQLGFLLHSKQIGCMEWVKLFNIYYCVLVLCCGFTLGLMVNKPYKI